MDGRSPPGYPLRPESASCDAFCHNAQCKSSPSGMNRCVERHVIRPEKHPGHSQPCARRAVIRVARNDAIRLRHVLRCGLIRQNNPVRMHLSIQKISLPGMMRLNLSSHEAGFPSNIPEVRSFVQKSPS
jgi:hypothetical protein